VKLRDTPENRVVSASLLAIKGIVWLERNGIGMADYGSSRVPYGVGGRGGSDYIGAVLPQHRNAGRFIAVEFKRHGGKPDEADLTRRLAAGDYCPGPCKHERCKLVYQWMFILKVRRAGGIALFADCPEDIIQAIEEAR
jgi:hypothetical protein